MDKITLAPEAHGLPGPATAQGGYAAYGGLYQNACSLLQAHADMMRASLEEAAGAYAELMSCRSPQDVASALQRRVEPAWRRAARYQEHVASILMTMQQDMQGIAREQQALTIEGGATPVGRMQEAGPLAWLPAFFGPGNPYAQAIRQMQEAMQETAQSMQMQMRSAPMRLPTGEAVGQTMPTDAIEQPKR